MLAGRDRHRQHPLLDAAPDVDLLHGADRVGDILVLRPDVDRDRGRRDLAGVADDRDLRLLRIVRRNLLHPLADAPPDLPIRPVAALEIVLLEVDRLEVDALLRQVDVADRPVVVDRRRPRPGRPAGLAALSDPVQLRLVAVLVSQKVGRRPDVEAPERVVGVLRLRRLKAGRHQPHRQPEVARLHRVLEVEVGVVAVGRRRRAVVVVEELAAELRRRETRNAVVGVDRAVADQEAELRTRADRLSAEQIREVPRLGHDVVGRVRHIVGVPDEHAHAEAERLARDERIVGRADAAVGVGRAAAFAEVHARVVVAEVGHRADVDDVAARGPSRLRRQDGAECQRDKSQDLVRLHGSPSRHFERDFAADGPAACGFIGFLGVMRSRTTPKTRRRCASTFAFAFVQQA